MTKILRNLRRGASCLLWACGILVVAGVARAGDITVNVVDHTGAAVSGFRWLLQEDATFNPIPGVAGATDILAFGFHKSYHPLASTGGVGLKGNTDSNSTLISNVANGRYYVSVLPYAGYSISGAPVVINGAGNPTVTVTVQQHPIPTAQISIFVFHDNQPINGAPDLPSEENPPLGDPDHIDWTQFTLFLEEPAGRYGIAGGEVIQDAFGNPLGTSYLQTCDANGQNPGSGAYGCLDANGDPMVASLGNGSLHPDENGFLLVKNLVPGKYGIIMIPPTGGNWQQTVTIEGTKVNDAWVKAKEPPFFVEFGPPGPHVFVGFIKSTANGGFPALTGSTTVSGRIADIHLSPPPSSTFFAGRAFPDCWVGLNTATLGIPGDGLYAAPCSPDSTFDIPNVPPGSYSLSLFDTNLDVIFAQLPFTVDAGGGTCNGGQPCDFGKNSGAPVGVFNWFTRLTTGIFNDSNQNGFWNDDEIGIGPESQNVNLRWRDGTIYFNFPTDGEGIAPFDEAFPFFNWLVAEVSFANKKATGVTFVIDAGGEVPTDAGWTMPSFGELTPQPQVCTAAQAGNPDDPDFGCTPGDPITNPNTGNNLSRTETGPVLTTGFQGFIGQTGIMQFGKADYKVFDFSVTPPTFVGENGGISGIVHYATTRAENEPQFAAAEEWEPGVPRVQVALYADGDIDSFPQGNWPTGVGDVDWDGDGVLDGDDNVIDDIDRNGSVTLADVDNYPFGFSDCTDHDNDGLPDGGCTAAKGGEDIDRDGDGLFDFGDAVQVVWTDSWDDNLPTGCQGEVFFAYGNPASPTDCYDGLRNWNQIRPAVFDGGYAFADYNLEHLTAIETLHPTSTAATAIQNYYAAVGSVPNVVLGLLPGDYIVESATPPGYEHIKEEDRNVDFGDSFIPSPEALAVACVGENHVVPPHFTMLTKDGSGLTAQLIDPTVTDGSPFAGQNRALCDRKKVPLSSGQNAAADFFVMTDVPPVANVVGIILNDLANEFDPNAPTFGEKFAPPWVPIAFYDWNGDLLNRVYSDQFGTYNAVLPSTYTVNIGMPSGVSPNVVLSCMNDPGPIANPQYCDPVTYPNPVNCPQGTTQNVPATIIDPFYDSQYSQFCYTLQYMPGTVTYLDTPVVSIAAFTNTGGFPVDCERPTSTPIIGKVTRVVGSVTDGPFVLPGNTIRITSLGIVNVPNPEWDGTATSTQPKTIQRSYGFGALKGNGKVELEDAQGVRTEITSTLWNDDVIEATVPGAMATGDYQVVVTRNIVNQGIVGDPLAESPISATLTVGRVTASVEVGVRADNTDYAVYRVAKDNSEDFTSIQAAINAAAPGDLILVEPGTYDELVIMWKPVKLQGWGAGEVTLNARLIPTNKTNDWRALTVALTDGNPANGEIDLLPGQTVGQFGFPALGAQVFATEEGAGILVAGRASGPDAFGTLANQGARIDGLSIFGAGSGGGVVVNGYAQDLVISNNRITGNAGAFGGGVRIGHPLLSHQVADVNDPAYDPPNVNIGDLVYTDASNDRIRVHHNQIDKNGSTGGDGGGLSLFTGTDDYKVSKNWVCGNFSQGNGGGIAHAGVSNNGQIDHNFVIFNESFSQGSATSGGGLFVGGEPALMLDAAGRLLTPGSGNVTINANRFRGNSAGGGDGGGISVAAVNGADVARSLGNTAPWYAVDIFNNSIDNNVTGLAGGGIAIQDALKVTIRNNTLANNDSTATANVNGAFLPGQFNQSIAQPAGIISRTHGAELALLMADVTPGLVPANWLAFSDPDLSDSIILHNRSFYWANAATTGGQAALFPSCETDPANPGTGCTASDIEAYSMDLAVMEGTMESNTYALSPRYCLLQNPGDYPVSSQNERGDDSDNGDFNEDFINGYFNQPRQTTLILQEATSLATAGAFDEGGNFLQVTYGPLTLIEPNTNQSNLLGYHLNFFPFATNAVNQGSNPNTVTYPLLAQDLDGQPRPNSTDTQNISDIGADELLTVEPLADTDGDGVPDPDDNCTEVANTNQRDTDGDGYGNACDMDLDNSGFTNIIDLSLFRSVLGKPVPNVVPYVMADHADFDGSGGVVNIIDYTKIRGALGKVPGPSCCGTP